MRKLIIPFLTLVLSSFCYGNPLDTFEARVVISKEVERTIDSPTDILIELGVIPGAIYGNPQEAPAWFEPIEARSKVSIPINRVQSDFHELAEILTKEAIELGLEIKPKDARIARVSMFGVDKRTREHQSTHDHIYGAFHNREGDFLILVYFDRPCDITGIVYWGLKPMNHSLHVETSGFYWIHVTQGKERYELNILSSLPDVQIKIGE